MKPLAEQNLYEILEVTHDASPSAIEAAVERARALYGPGSLVTYTLMTPEEAELLGRRIEEARETLLDPDLRALYDEEITRPEPPAPARPAAPQRAAPWPSPPVIPPFRGFPPDDEEEDEDELDVDEAVPPRAVAGPARAPVEAARSSPPSAPPPAPPPILLSRELPARTPAPVPLSNPVPGPIATPVPMNPPAAAPALPPVDTTTWSGEVLRQIREARGISLVHLSERTKVTRHHIENIEGDRFGLLPAPVYLRGILMSLARELRLDGQKVARSYLERYTAATATPPPPTPPKSR